MAKSNLANAINNSKDIETYVKEEKKSGRIPYKYPIIVLFAIIGSAVILSETDYAKSQQFMARREAGIPASQEEVSDRERRFLGAKYEVEHYCLDRPQSNMCLRYSQAKAEQEYYKDPIGKNNKENQGKYIQASYYVAKGTPPIPKSGLGQQVDIINDYSTNQAHHKPKIKHKFTNNHKEDINSRPKSPFSFDNFQNLPPPPIVTVKEAKKYNDNLMKKVIADNKADQLLGNIK